MKNYKALVLVPGYEKNQIKVTLMPDKLTPWLKNVSVRAENEEFGIAEASVYPDVPIDESSVKAELKNGYLYLNWNQPKELQCSQVVVE